jgi:hypothetical protein
VTFFGNIKVSDHDVLSIACLTTENRPDVLLNLLQRDRSRIGRHRKG